MKNVILTLVTVLAFNLGNAQEIDIFESKLTGKKNQVRAIQLDTFFVVEIPNKTALEIYRIVELATSEQWVNPDEVISGRSEGSFLKINGGGSSIVYNPVASPFNTEVHYNFQFKDGRLRYTVKHLVRYPVSQYSAGGLHESFFTLVSRKGTDRKLEMKNKDIVNNDVNSFIALIIEKSKEDNNINSNW